MKKDFIVAINYAKYFAFVMATVCVLIFQFAGIGFCINLALSLYVVAFGLMTASLVIHANEINEALKTIKKQILNKGWIFKQHDFSRVVFLFYIFTNLW